MNKEIQINELYKWHHRKSVDSVVFIFIKIVTNFSEELALMFVDAMLVMTDRTRIL